MNENNDNNISKTEGHQKRGKLPTRDKSQRLCIDINSGCPLWKIHGIYHISRSYSLISEVWKTLSYYNTPDFGQWEP